MGLHASVHPLEPEPPEGMAVLHTLFRPAEELPEWSRLCLAVGADRIAAALGAESFVTEAIDKLPPEVNVAMEAGLSKCLPSCQVEESRPTNWSPP